MPDRYMSPRAVGGLLNLMSDLDLITANSNGEISVDAQAVTFLGQPDPKSFDKLVQLRAKTCFERSGIRMDQIHRAIGTIRLPMVPDARTIHAKLTSKRDSGPPMSLDKFRRLIYLYACTGGIDRFIRTYYYRPGNRP